MEEGWKKEGWRKEGGREDGGRKEKGRMEEGRRKEGCRIVEVPNDFSSASSYFIFLLPRKTKTSFECFSRKKEIAKKSRFHPPRGEQPGNNQH